MQFGGGLMLGVEELLNKARLGRSIFLTLSLLAFLPNIAYPQESKTIKVGAILSFSGGLEQWCSHIRRGIELAANDEQGAPIKILFEDDHSVDKKAALTSAQKLIQIDKVDLLYSWTPSTLPTLLSVVSKSKTPLLIGAFDRNVAKHSPDVLGAFVNYDLAAREIARFFFEKRGAKRFAIVMAADEWSQTFEKPFKEEIEKLGATLAVTETILPDESDTRSLVIRLKEQKIDAILAPLYGNALFSLLREAKELKLESAISVGDGMFEEDLKILGNSAEGVYASQIWLESPELTAKIKARYGEEVNALQLGLVATGYDWVKHVRSAISSMLEQGKEVNRESLKEFLKTFKSEGYLGEQMYGAPPSQSGEIIMQASKGVYLPVQVR